VPDATWHDDLASLPPGPALILANEFLDALPIRQFIRRNGTWAERWVADGAFIERPAEAAPPLPAEAPEGAIQEVCEPALALAATLARRLTAQGGAALFLDYGPATSSFGDSLQAVKAHQFANPLAEPGSVDLTAHVDFAALARIAQAAGAAAHGPLPQGIFLQRLGLMSRAAILARSNPRQAGHILSGAQRLVAPEAMGQLFKALALCHPALPTPPGFEAA
jgi:SAM-dependent MidA family methyltransferase